ncbi:MAG: dTMP kinase [Dethiobacteria bacterium]|nr:dTMP kinase [Bacillota bacterium]HOB29594.1 dTMP kinase [Bacillota bacterium]HPZ40899.1 dTMP kinase [Bacillota bacterium]HQD51989.1 dTMP kinase [Bacillota bacterium]
MSGFLITLEGIDGCGKTTQARMLKERLEREAIPHLLTREPGGTAAGEKIRLLLLQKEHSLTDTAEILLYMAARAELVDTVIRPALEAGQVVVCDRYLDSTVAYQGYGGQGDRAWIEALNKRVTKGLWPHLTFLFDLSVEEALRRRCRSGDRIEERALSYHRRVRQGYRAIAEEEPARVILIDATAPAERQHEVVWIKIRELFGLVSKKEAPR